MSTARPRGTVMAFGGREDTSGDMLVLTEFVRLAKGGRGCAAIPYYPHHVGMGIGEDTAIVFHQQVLSVLGAGSVTVIDAEGITMTNLAGLERDQNLALHDIRVYVLPEPYRFDLEHRRPLEPKPFHKDGRSAPRRLRNAGSRKPTLR